MSALPPSLRAAQMVGIVSAGWISGNIAAFSANVVPGLLRSRREEHYPASSLVKQWRNFFENGRAQNPPIVALSAAAFLYLAWSVRPGSSGASHVPYNSALWYCAAAALTLGTIPFTLIVMNRTNEALAQKAKCDAESVNKDHEEVDRLVRKWKTLNGVRSLLPLLGCIAGVVAIVS
ncbi:hypothetical protein BDV28DRAFT_31061 [Aspergillus coremiiformis]|uniref:DUF1772-domain-containing protein n=1 Tax=Aspergillus coremiiformis TaxID=138285 RepID=A0A5N6ZDH1_9EURO|nr:hypothetical protein BDV28DRAFT_31061 [Aspergillus coremiiformis]